MTVKNKILNKLSKLDDSLAFRIFAIWLLYMFCSIIEFYLPFYIVTILLLFGLDYYKSRYQHLGNITDLISLRLDLKDNLIDVLQKANKTGKELNTILEEKFIVMQAVIDKQRELLKKQAEKNEKN